MNHETKITTRKIREILKNKKEFVIGEDKFQLLVA